MPDNHSDTEDDAPLVKALKRFGWKCGPEFEKRYYSDPWVFNLANAVERLTSENGELVELIGDLLDVAGYIDAPAKREVIGRAIKVVRAAHNDEFREAK